MTNFWEHLDGERETAEGSLMVDSAKAVGVKLVLLSSLVGANRASNGKLTNVYHFDAKAAISDHARAIGVPFVEIHAGGYMNNFISFSRPRAAGDDSYVVDGTWTETTKVPLLDTLHDFGLFVRFSIESNEFNKGDGKIISAYGEWISIADQIKILNEVTGKKVTYNKLSYDQSRAGLAQAGLPPHAIDDMIDMFKFQESMWENVLVESNRKELARRPRTFREYAEAEDWSTVFV
ncbi:hypothetical protein Ct61P_13117 [Colletotrichum tofieldiae]|nr:hypothetical protein Ct61P_13117 [Colletotrichum tofieldiae]